MRNFADIEKARAKIVLNPKRHRFGVDSITCDIAIDPKGYLSSFN